MEEKKEKSGKKGIMIAAAVGIVAVVAVILLLFIRSCSGDGPVIQVISGIELAEQLAAPGDAAISVNEDIVIDSGLVVNGNKTLVGSGSITLNVPLEGSWPESEISTWGMGCAKIEAEDATAMGAMIYVEKGSHLTLGNDIRLDAANQGNGILVDGKLTIDGQAIIANGRYANLVVAPNGEAQLKNGQLLDGNVHNVINYGTLELAGTKVSGAKAGAVVYTEGIASQNAGILEKAAFHNVYVAKGSFTMVGGDNTAAAKDAIVIAQGASAEVTGGNITNCNHGICNNGDLTVGAITLEECGLMNNKGAVMTLNGTTVDTSATYCLANNGGTVNATDFTARGCDTCAVYNFSGDMNLTNLTVEGSRDANVSNAGGNLTVNGALLGVCRDKSVTVGNGIAVLNNVQIEGTTNEKYGIYAFGGQLFVNDSSIKNVSSTAVKVDAGSYVELNNVDIKDVEQNGFQAEGGKITAEKVTMENMGSHGIYNNGGEVLLKDLTVTTVEKNGIQHKAGTTTIDGIALTGTGNHGAYVENGQLTVKNGTFKDMAANGFYLPAGDSKLVLEKTTISGAVQQGINNESKVELKNVTISDMGKNGIYNKVGGDVTIDGLTVSDVKEHGINNKAKLTASDVIVKNTGAGSNGIQNNGTMKLTDTSIANSKNHGLYNNGTLDAQQLTISGTNNNGLYNDKGTAAVTLLSISDTKEQGVNNNAKITLDDVHISQTGKNGVYNSDGEAVITKLTVRGTKEHGINNVGTLTVKNTDISGTGDGSNSIQNSGTITLEKVTLTGSKNHGIYNKGTLSGTEVTVKDTANNGLYNDKGTVSSLKGLTVSNTGAQGINNNSKITLEDVKISGTAKNGIYNSDGTAVIDKAEISGTKEHGVNNVGTMTLKNAEISDTGSNSNSVQNSGTLTLEKTTSNSSKNHGIYNKGKLSGSNVTIKNAANNGIYNDKGTIDSIKGLTVAGAVNQGVNNTGTFVASDINISGTKKNGIYNNGGKATVSGLKVTDPGEHGFSNDNNGTAVVTDSTLTGSGKGSNCIQNKGTMTLKNVKAVKSSNHGIYNSGELKSEGTVTVEKAAVNGIYNYGGQVTLATTHISGSGEHGVNNAGTLTGEVFVINGVTANGIQNSGTMTVSGSADIKDSGKHGMFNGDTFTGKNITVENAGDLLMSNAGDMVVYVLTLDGTAHKALYNNGYAELYTVSVDGTDIVTGNKSEYLLDNNGGILDLTGATIVNAKNIALELRGNGSVSVTNVIIDHVGNYGVLIEQGSTLSGDGFVINNVTKDAASLGYIDNVEGIAMKIAGKATMMDHVTLGAYDNKVTGSGMKVTRATSGLISNGIQLDAATASYSGYDLTIQNTPQTGIYCKGQLYVTDLKIDNAKHGISARYSGWATLSGDVTIRNVSGNPITIYGPEKNNSNVNGVTLTHGSTMLLENAGSHAVNNKGSFLAAEDTALTVRNMKGKNINAINNQKGAVMTLGEVNVDGIYVDITMYNSNTINSNSGNAIMNSGDLELNGAVTIENIFYKPANNKTDNSNGSGVVAKNAGQITGTGSITVLGAKAEDIPEGYKSIFNGIFTTKRTIDIDGDIYIENASNQGIYVADANAALKAGNITVKNVGGNGIYVNNASGQMEAKHIIAENTTQHGLSNSGTVNAESITLTNVGTSGAQNGINNNKMLQVSGDISITTAGARGISNGGTLTAANVTIEGVGENGIQNNSTNGAAMTVSGAVVIKNTKSHGIYNGGSEKGRSKVAFGSLSISDVAKNGVNNAGEFVVEGELSVTRAVAAGVASNWKLTAGQITIDTVTNGPGVNSSGSQFTVTGLTSVKNITGTATSAIWNKNTMVLGDVMIDGVKIIIGKDKDDKQNTYVGNGITNDKNLTLNGTAKISNVFTDVNGNNVGAGLAVKPKATVNGTGSIEITGSASTDTAYPYGINNGIFLDAATLDIEGDVTVTDVTLQGIYVANENAALTCGDIIVSNTAGNGIYVNKTSGSLTAGDIVLSNITQHGLNNVGTANVTSVTATAIGKNGINNNGGTLTVSDAIRITSTEDAGVGSAGILKAGSVSVDTVKTIGLNIKGNTTITGDLTIVNAGTHGVSVNYGGVTLTVGGNVLVDGAKGRGISNTQNTSHILITGDLTVKNVNVNEENAIDNGHANNRLEAASITVSNVTGAIGSDKINKGNGIFNKGTIKATNISVSDVATTGGKDATCRNGVYNTGKITANNIIVTEVTKGRGINSKGGSVKATETININNVKADIGMYLEGNTTVEANTIQVSGTKSHCIQVQQANTLKAETLIVTDSAEGNGLRIFNTNGQPTIEITTMVATNCNQRGLTADADISSANMKVETLYWLNCSVGAKDNCKDCVTTIKEELPAQSASSQVSEDPVEESTEAPTEEPTTESSAEETTAVAETTVAEETTPVAEESTSAAEEQN